MTPDPKSYRDPILILILLASLGLNTHRIGHPGLHYFDESFHAIVAQNLVKHPLRPTLIDTPYLAYDPTSWVENHIWLHKPILPLWLIAASFATFGVNTYALRLPSALLATGAIGLTFLIGRELFDRRTGLIAASLQAINPAITMLVQGYLFSDHIDISLLFWVEVGAYFLVRATQSGHWLDVAMVGVAQGLAYLSKSYLAALLSGLAAIVWLLPRLGMVDRGDSRLRGRHLLGLVSATLLTIAPWMIACAVRWPIEFQHEHGYVFTHLGQGVENWGGPWDRLVFDYLILLYQGFYPALIVSGVVLLGAAWAERRLRLWFLFAWLFGVLLPHAIAATKTPSATLIALPAGFLLLSHLMVEGWRGQPRALLSWAAIMIVGAVRPASIGRFGRGYPDPIRFGGVMLQSLWVLEHLAWAVIVVLALRAICRCKAAAHDPWTRGVRVVAVLATLMVAARVGFAAWAVTDGGEGRPFVTELANFARGRLPANAVFLFDGPDRGEHQLAMFLLDRTCYSLQGRPADKVARQVADMGGQPYVVTCPGNSWPCWFDSPTDTRGVYQWQGSPALPQMTQAPVDHPARQ